MHRISGATIEFSLLSDTVLLGWLAAAAGRGPNILIECPADQIGSAVAHVMTWSTRPLHYSALPGRLDLPAGAGGTLLLSDVAALSRPQQIAVYDWLSAHTDDTRIISLTSHTLTRLVADGVFLEALYYRLNMVRLDAAHGTRPAPLDIRRATLAHQQRVAAVA